MKKIQQLALGDSPVKKGKFQNEKGSNEDGNDSNFGSRGRDSSSNTLERDSKVEVVRELEDDLNEAAKVPVEAEETANELTVNDMTMNQESSHNIFTQEREYDHADIDKAQNCSAEVFKDKDGQEHKVFGTTKGPPDSQCAQVNAINFNGVSLALGGYSQSESNLMMRASSNNEHTSSSLGKRNYNDYSKKQSSGQEQVPENKSSGKKCFPAAMRSYVTQGPALQMIDESESVECLSGVISQRPLTLVEQSSDASKPEIVQRLKKTPARRVQGLRRQKSDIFGKEQVQQSGQKLLRDDSNRNDDSSNMQVIQMLTSNQIHPMRSDAMMSS